MPELPEVETVVSDLNVKIKGDKIVGFWSEWEKAIKGKTIEKFRKEIVGRVILGVRRIGKNIFIDLSGGKTLYLHLKMTGHLLIKESKKKRRLEKGGQDHFSDKVNQYIRHSWTLKRGREELRMDFSDLRKFAKIVLVDTDRVGELPEIKKLGVDALAKEFTLAKFEEILNKKRKTPIGLILMEQGLIAGIGNIYRSEILFASAVAPTKLIEKLKTEEIRKIYQNIRKILEKAVKLRGTSDSDYRDTAGAPGGFQKMLCVYRKDGEKCPRCGRIIERGKMGQRSFFIVWVVKNRKKSKINSR